MTSIDKHGPVPKILTSGKPLHSKDGFESLMSLQNCIIACLQACGLDVGDSLHPASGASNDLEPDIVCTSHRKKKCGRSLVAFIWTFPLSFMQPEGMTEDELNHLANHMNTKKKKCSAFVGSKNFPASQNWLRLG